MSGGKRARKERRRLQRSIKRQEIEYSVLIGERWSQSIVTTLKFVREIVPPEHRKSPGRFLGYTTVFEALAVAEKHRNRVLVIYQTDQDPVIPKSKQHWFGRFHVFLTSDRSKQRRKKKAVRWVVLNTTDKLPDNVIRMRVVGVYRKPYFDSEVRNLLQNSELNALREGYIYPTDLLFLRIDHKKHPQRTIERTRNRIRRLHSALVDLIISQGALEEDEIHELIDGDEVVVVPSAPGAKPHLDVYVDQINLASLYSTAAVKLVKKDGVIAEDADRVNYVKGKMSLAGSVILIGEEAVQRGFVSLLSTLHHESLHVRQHHRARAVIDEWRKTKTKTALIPWFEKQMKEGRRWYSQIVHPNVVGFSELNHSEHIRALNEMNPHLQQLSLSLIVDSWDSPKIKERLQSIAGYQYNYIKEPSASLDAITAEWAPTFRARFRALDTATQATVRAAISELDAGGTGAFAEYLTEALDP